MSKAAPAQGVKMSSDRSGRRFMTREVPRFDARWRASLEGEQARSLKAPTPKVPGDSLRTSHDDGEDEQHETDRNHPQVAVGITGLRVGVSLAAAA